MKKHSRLSGWQPWLLLFAAVFCVGGSAQETDEAKAAAAKAKFYAKAEENRLKHCAGKIAVRQKYHPEDGLESALLLREINNQLERRFLAGKLTLQNLFDEGIIRYSGVPVTDNSGQSMPYVELLFPWASTGVYIPTEKKGKPIDPTQYDGTFFAMPGIGFSVSVAKSMFEIMGTFRKGENPALAISGRGPLRLISIGVDAPLNGLGEKAAFHLGHPEYVMELIRMVRLAFALMYPMHKDRDIWAGRSQGGLNVLEAATRFPTMAGAIALNASNPDPKIVQGCIDRHEEMVLPENVERARACGFDINFHELSWLAHEYFTPFYQTLTRKTLVPTFHMMGDKDWSYPPEYIPSWQAWNDRDPQLRRYRVFNGAHNLWMRPKGDGEERFGEVVGAMKDFIVEALHLRP